MKIIFIILTAVVFTATATPPPAGTQERPAADDRVPAALYSRHALRSARLLIQMRMLELREERLECVRRILLRRLPPDLTRGALDSSVKHSGAAEAREDCTWVSTRRRRRRRTA